MAYAVVLVELRLQRDDYTLARLVQLRAEAVRSDAAGVVVGIVAVTIAEVLVVALFRDRSTTPWLWIHAGALAFVLSAASAMLVAQRRLRPDDAALVNRWLPLSRQLGAAFDLIVVLGPWVLLPLATPIESGILYLIYAWFLAVVTMVGNDDGGDARRSLIGLPLSLSAYLLVHGVLYSVPLSILFCAAGLTLSFYEHARRRRLTESYLERINGERAATDLLARLEALSPPQVATLVAANEGDAGGRLTPRQIEVLRHVADGRSNKEIARELNISPATVKVHVAQILATTGAGNRTAAAVAMARQA